MKNRLFHVMLGLIVSFIACNKDSFDFDQSLNPKKIENFWEYTKDAPILNAAIIDLQSNKNAKSFEAYISEIGRPLWNASKEFTDSVGISTLLVPVTDKNQQLTTALIIFRYMANNY